MALTTIPSVLGKSFNIADKITASTTFTVPSTSTGFIDLLVVGGGGAGGRASNASPNAAAAGGGGGAILYYPDLVVTPGGTLTITIGAGAASQTVNNSNGASGTQTMVVNNTGISSLFNQVTNQIIADGGEGGISYKNNTNNISLNNSMFFNTRNTFYGSGPLGVFQMDFGGGFISKNSPGSGTTENNSNGSSGQQAFADNTGITLFSTTAISRSTASFCRLITRTVSTVAVGTSGGSATGTGGSSTANTGFAGNGGNGGFGASSGNGGAGKGGGGGGGAGTNNVGGTAGSGGAATVNSGAGGGGGGGWSTTSGVTGNGGAGGSGFVIIGGWW
jgi:hypothetical protein